VHRYLLVAAFALATLPSFVSQASAAPNPGPAQMTNPSAIVQVDSRCGRGRHYVPRHHEHGHLIGGRCVRG
jgi:hypothetical protein